jgi:chromosome segregation ATPase
MAKTNFTKVEEALSEGLRKITVNNLLDTADAISGKKATVSASQDVSAQKKLLITLQHDLKQLHKQMPGIYAEINIPQTKLKEFLSHSEQISLEDWEKIKKAKKKCDELKEKHSKLDSLPQDADLISKERRKHINKRFNINEKWLPLK